MKTSPEILFKKASRETLLVTIRTTVRQSWYDAARQELYRRDTERLKEDWARIMTGQR